MSEEKIYNSLMSLIRKKRKMVDHDAPVPITGWSLTNSQETILRKPKSQHIHLSHMQQIHRLRSPE